MIEENLHMSVPYTPNQLVAHNLARFRKQRGLTQAETVELLEPFLGLRWSVASLSAAERSVDGKRIKEFNADELVALSRAFDVPLAFWFIPPSAEQWVGLAVAHLGDEPFSIEALLDVLFGRADNRHLLEQALLAASPDLDPSVTRHRLDADTALLLRRRLHWVFGDVGQAREVLDRVATVLEQIEALGRNVSSPTGTNTHETEPIDSGQPNEPKRRKT
jgi:transcriptional regulator with XRE-family HTH domain